MANQVTGEQGFLANLGKVYGIYTGGFLAFIILVAILEQLGEVYMLEHSCNNC